MKAACIAGDPGGARCLSPVIAELIQRGVDVQLIAYRQGLAILQEHGLPVVVCDEMLASKAAAYLNELGVDLLLCSTSMNGQDFEKTFIQAAAQFGIVSISILDFWSNYRGRFTTQPPAGGLDALPDWIAVMDTRAVEEMVADGFPETRLVITGQPAFDELFLPRDVAAIRQRVRAELGCSEGDLLLIFASQPFSEVTAESGISPVGYDEMECLDLLIESLKGISMRPKIWVRPHPRETIEKFTRFSYEPLIVSSEFDRISAILAADGVVGMSSNFLLEAALLGLAVLSIQPRQTGPGPLPLVSLNLGQVVTDTSALTEAVTFWIPDCRRPHSSQVPATTSPFRAGAASRVADLVLNRLPSPKPTL
ncbi:MAG: hypothetical protein WCO60_05790 [Verrucomicrobiota bacterium]